MAIRIGVIGAGQAGRQHARAFSASRRATLAWIADPVRERAEALAVECGARATTDMKTVLADVAAVSICVPHAFLAEIAIFAAEARVHMLLEKPMATTLQDAERVLKSAAQAGVVLMVGFVHRYRPEAQRAEALIAEGAIGEPCFLTDFGFGGDQAAWPAWVQDSRSGGGLLLYSGVHRFDRARWLLGRDVVDVRGSVAALLPGSDVDSSYSALLTFEAGVRAALSLHYHAVRIPFAWETVVHGTHGLVHLRTGKGLDIVSGERSWQEDAERDRHFHGEIAAFLDAIEGSEAAIPTGVDGWAALAVARGIVESHASGRTVRLNTAEA